MAFAAGFGTGGNHGWTPRGHGPQPNEPQRSQRLRRFAEEGVIEVRAARLGGRIPPPCVFVSFKADPEKDELELGCPNGAT